MAQASNTERTARRRSRNGAQTYGDLDPGLPLGGIELPPMDPVIRAECLARLEREGMLQPPVHGLRWLDKVLAARELVPPGWRPTALALRRRLLPIARECANRLACDFYPDDEDTEDLLVPLKPRDRVVAGMVRKANRQAAARCRVCGALAVTPPEGLPPGLCSKHLAPSLIHWFAHELGEEQPVISRAKKTPIATTPAVRLPALLVRRWLDHAGPVGTDGVRERLAAARSGRGVTLDAFDQARVAAWLRSLEPRLQQETHAMDA
jgi:hypothetical protein